MVRRVCNHAARFLVLFSTRLFPVPHQDRILGVRRFSFAWRAAFPARMGTPPSSFSVRHKVGNGGERSMSCLIEKHTS